MSDKKSVVDLTTVDDLSGDSSSSKFSKPSTNENPVLDDLALDKNSHDESKKDAKEKSINMEAKPSIGKLLSLARPEFSVLTVAALFMVIAEATGLINPLVIAQAYDHLVDPDLISSDRMSKINSTMTIVLLLHGCGIVFGFLRSSLMGVAGERVVARLRNTLFQSILKQEIAFFDEYKTGDLVSRLGSDTTLIQKATSLALPEIMLGVIKIVTALVLMFWISVPLAGVTIGFSMFIILVCIPFGKVIGNLSKKYQDVLAEAQTRSTEALGAMRTVQSFAAEDREQKYYSDKIGDPAEYKFWWPTKGSCSSQESDLDDTNTYSVGFFKAIASTGFFVFVFGVGFGSMYVSLWYGFRLVNEGVMTIGELTAFQSYIFQIGIALGSTSSYLSQLFEAVGASGKIFFLLERIPLIPTPRPTAKDLGKKKLGNDTENPAPPFYEATKVPASMVGSVELRGVSFSYPSRPDVKVLEDINLSMAPNTTTALVGASGGGKSTVVSLLQRFYDINEGSILIDGNDVRSLDLRWLRSNIGYVQQEPSLFGLSIRENLCYGVDRVVSEDEIDNVCKEANAYEFIQKWPSKYDTLVGERGVKLSGGQKQRIAIARALLVNPRILLLDEATSALDSESEHLVQEAIDKAVVGRTVLIVAHRLSTIRSADQIVVIENHQVADIGTHSELQSSSKKYQDLIKRQSVMKLE
mmetsp:Transcript_26160/g.40122  ORF Transcript_26160/g.40122 Transcript_26160/m.40122 type:complete len:696 (-) Transcript_26160:1635-3722(-)|eukprot:CAMPEP_0195289716 /NCGR_PEP_ID=MMETSP0707-20130614/5876_1 /TAXON_ID=33640 /ORGANISM="Asterionellopsis glacialis, Strain CCMP134" /LENGTH=695 /DNA_ID=CAMNT_0040349749 /DNA_START=32 /DNA_END=2119 /DNA_ORIENTATION=+